MSVGHIIIAIAIVLVMGVVAIDVINNIMGYMIKKKDVELEIGKLSLENTAIITRIDNLDTSKYFNSREVAEFLNDPDGVKASDRDVRIFRMAYELGAKEVKKQAKEVVNRRW